MLFSLSAQCASQIVPGFITIPGHSAPIHYGCQATHTQPGVLGGWQCSCWCHSGELMPDRRRFMEDPLYHAFVKILDHIFGMAGDSLTKMGITE